MPFLELISTESARASLSLYIALMKSDNGLDLATRELLATVVSHTNDCYY